MIKNYVEQMNSREKIMVGLAVVVVLIYSLYLLVIEPINEAQKIAAKRLIEKKETLLWMQQVKHLAGGGSRTKVSDTSQLLSVITEQLSQSSLQTFPYQLQQNDSGNVQLSFEKVPFNSFIAFLVALQSNYTIPLERLNAVKLEQEGLVKLTAVFQS